MIGITIISIGVAKYCSKLHTYRGTAQSAWASWAGNEECRRCGPNRSGPLRGRSAQSPTLGVRCQRCVASSRRAVDCSSSSMADRLFPTRLQLTSRPNETGAFCLRGYWSKWHGWFTVLLKNCRNVHRADLDVVCSIRSVKASVNAPTRSSGWFL